MLSRRQEAVSEFFQSASELQRLSRNWPDQSLAKLTEVLVNSIVIFGETEHFAREAERCNILGIQKDREEFCNKMVKKRNSDGLAVLSDSSKAIKLVRKRVKAFRNNSTEKTNKELKAFDSSFADMLVDSHLKPSDVGKIQKVVEEVVSVGKNKGAPGIVSLLDGNIEELRQLRKRDDRGAIDNIPYWKLVAVALFLGVAVIAIIHCSTVGCRGSEISYAAALIVLGLIALFC